MTDRDDTHELAERIASSVQERIDDHERSRRGFLGRSALLGGAVLAMGGATGFALAQEQAGEHGTDGTRASFDDVHGTDLDVLAYALSLERLESAFYAAGLEAFAEADFVGADALQSLTEDQRRQARARIQTIGEQEATHVEVLTQAIEFLGGDLPAEETYEFGLESVGGFLGTAATLENTGTAAYAGAAPFVESPDLLGTALAIHSVEARHAAELNALSGQSPFPDTFDPAMAQGDVLDAVAPFVVEEPEPTPTPTEEPDNATATETPTVTEVPGNATATETPLNETQ